MSGANKFKNTKPKKLASRERHNLPAPLISFVETSNFGNETEPRPFFTLLGRGFVLSSQMRSVAFYGFRNFGCVFVLATVKKSK
jgi:hypothetical protein